MKILKLITLATITLSQISLVSAMNEQFNEQELEKSLNRYKERIRKGSPLADVVIKIISDYADIEKNLIEANKKLDLALNEQDFNGIKQAIENGADVNLENNQGETALMRAIKLIFIRPESTRLNVIDLIYLILNNGADVNERNPFSGETALILLVKRGKDALFDKADLVNRLAQQLILNGAKIDLVDNKGNTASDYAISNENLLLLKVLEPHRYKEEVIKLESKRQIEELKKLQEYENKKQQEQKALEQILESIKIKEEQQKQEKLQIQQQALRRQEEQRLAAQRVQEALAQITMQTEEDVWAEEPETTDKGWENMEQED